MLRRLRAPLFAVGIVGTALSSGCPSLPDPMPCGPIPEGGCPIGRGGTCDDPSCTGVYDCVNGEWTRTLACSRDAGAGGGGSPPADAGADACTPVSIDTQGQTTGCTPDLEEPDCPSQAVGACAETACTSGCLDFFLCTKDGWKGVAHCTDDGQFVEMP